MIQKDTDRNERLLINKLRSVFYRGEEIKDEDKDDKHSLSRCLKVNRTIMAVQELKVKRQPSDY